MRRRRDLRLRSGPLQPGTIEAGKRVGRGMSIDGADLWKPWTVWPAMAVVFGTILLGRGLVRDGGDPRAGVVIGLMAQSLICVGLAVLFAAAHARPKAVDFGLRRSRLLPAVGLTIVVTLVLVVFTAAWAEVVGIADDAPSITDRLVADSSTSHALLVLVMLAVAVPLGEEFVFRGYVFRALRNWRGTWPAATLTGMGFAATHVGWIPLGMVVAAAVFGFGLCMLYQWTGSLYPPLALHAVANSLPTATAVGWTWQVPLAMAFSVLGTLAIARLVAVQLDRLSTAPTGSDEEGIYAPEPAEE